MILNIMSTLNGNYRSLTENSLSPMQKIIATIGTKKIGFISALVSIILIMIICISIRSNQTSNQSPKRETSMMTTKSTTTTITSTITTTTTTMTSTTTTTTTTTTVIKSTSIHTSVQCDALGGDNVEWIDGTHLRLGCLGFVKSKQFPKNAKTFCTSLDSHLVEIFDQNQQDFIKQKAQQIGENFWIGLRHYHAFIWEWMDSKSKQGIPFKHSYNAWAPGEPQSSSGERLAVLYKNQHYRWVDLPYGGQKFYSICQLTNKTIIDDLDVPIAPHHMNDTGTCIESNSHVNKLKGTSSKHVDGWNIDIDLITKTDDQHNYYDRCKNFGGPKDFWAGCCGGKIISTTLYGCGHATLNVGNCWRSRHHPVHVYLDGKLIGEVSKNTNSKVFKFGFIEGSVLKINSNGGIIKFNNFEVTNCNCEN